MSRSGSLTYQVLETLKSKRAFGQSKHQDKRAGCTMDRIYSYKTFDVYKEGCNAFVKWVKDRYPAADRRTLNQCRSYVDDYIRWMQDTGKSPSTQKTRIAALAKLYGCRMTDFIPTEKRSRALVTRSRKETNTDKVTNLDRHKDLLTFATATGLRRREISQVRGSDIQKENGDLFVYVRKGKGGRPRKALVLPEYATQISKFAQNAGAGEDRLFPSVPKNLDIHAQRALYASMMYEKLARPIESLSRSERYDCRKDMAGIHLDKKAMLTVSQYLGHNRIGVIASNYLWPDSNL